MPRDRLHEIQTHTREARALSHALRLLLHHEHPMIVRLREAHLTPSERQWLDLYCVKVETAAGIAPQVGDAA